MEEKSGGCLMGEEVGGAMAYLVVSVAIVGLL